MGIFVEADICVDEIINKSKTPMLETKIINEEKKYNLESYLEKSYWIIDPIDGPRSYLNGGEEYTVNVALIVNGIPKWSNCPPQSKKFGMQKKIN